ncbi:hypothetical protein QU487_04735 [Crenobacter sp. SG2305]|uniref:hypothetical protein n=1 Tax=Crenobacter oryzisoli TaxID=3056844 RepID=UPI0025AADC87|nr:hypothetical protein [Crenobacter sp. SG2305]MDN0082060.1 hypothetical protein [Crenobacter sp. SG2305]
MKKLIAEEKKMPLLIPIICAIFGIGGIAYGMDQHNERNREQRNFRYHLKQLEKELSEKEEELTALRVRLGEKNDQVRILAAEIERLRQEIAATRKRA